MTEMEARALLDKYGPLELIVPTNNVDGVRFGMKQGMFVKFAYYLDCRDALRVSSSTFDTLQAHLTEKQCFQNHSSGYVLHMAPSVEPKYRQGPSGSPIVRGFSTPRSVVDQKSIFVGNLPDGATRQDLEEMFKEFGRIVQINVIRKTFGKQLLTSYSTFLN